MNMPGHISLSAEAMLRIPADHPALPGHFPGAPVVPGVVVLDHVVAAACTAFARPLRVCGLPQVKFTAPLLPEQSATVALQLAGDTLSFVVKREGAALASGTVRLSADAV